MRRDLGPIVRAATTVASSTGAALVLVACGTGPLATPRSWDPHRLIALVDERGPAATALTFIRLGTLAACAVLACVAVLTALAQAARVRWLDALVHRITPRVVRRLLGIVTVATLAAPRTADAAPGAMNPPIVVHAEAAGSPSGPAGPPPTMRRVGAPTASTPPEAAAAPRTTTVEVASVVSPIVTKPFAPVVQVTISPASPTERAPASSSTPATWTIARGEHLWHVAATTLAAAREVAPSTRETARYWRALIDANRDRLVDRDDPDLVFAGQVFVLPPTPPR